MSSGASTHAVFSVINVAAVSGRRTLPGLFKAMGTGFMLVLSLAAHSEDGTRHFDLPAQSLPLSLQAFSEQTGISILVTSDRIKDKNASAVRGRYAPDQALDRLLHGTGLRSRRLGESGLTLVPVPEPGEAAGETSSTSSMPARYTRSLQQSVLSGLCRRLPEQVGRFRLLVQLWTDQRGRITRVHIPDSEAEARHGDAVRAGFSELTLPTPPAGMPQPLTLLLRPGTPECGAAGP